MDHEWYRSTKWDSIQEKFFFDKINRTRSGKNQYLCIQALTLLETNHINYLPSVLKLLDYFFSLGNYTLFETFSSLSILEKYYLKLGDHATSFDILKFIVMEILPFWWNDGGSYRLDFIERVLRYKLSDYYEYCFEVLNRIILDKEISLPIEYYRVYVYLARLYQIDGMDEEMKQMLDLAYQFKEKPNNGIFNSIKNSLLGLVSKEVSLESVLLHDTESFNLSDKYEISDYWEKLRDQILEKSLLEGWSNHKNKNL